MNELSKDNSPAKYAFFYMLSLVALIFMALSTGMIIFQIINKNIKDLVDMYSYDSTALKFAISAIIISTPIYYVLMWLIGKSLFEGKLSKESEIRRWLSYLILFIASVVMIGWLIATIFSFLNGELTLKFILKSLTSIIISATVFTYYFYDIRRAEIAGKKDKIIKIYFYSSLAIIIAVLISAFVFVESPAETRNLKRDNEILNRFSNIDGAMNSFFSIKGKLPNDLNELMANVDYINENNTKDPITGQKFDYKVIDDRTYEICSNFMTSNKGEIKDQYSYYNDVWPHDKGYQCIKKNILAENTNVKVQQLTQPVK